MIDASAIGPFPKASAVEKEVSSMTTWAQGELCGASSGYGISKKSHTNDWSRQKIDFDVRSATHKANKAWVTNSGGVHPDTFDALTNIEDGVEFATCNVSESRSIAEDSIWIAQNNYAPASPKARSLKA